MGGAATAPFPRLVFSTAVPSEGLAAYAPHGIAIAKARHAEWLDVCRLVAELTRDAAAAAAAAAQRRQGGNGEWGGFAVEAAAAVIETFVASSSPVCRLTPSCMHAQCSKGAGKLHACTMATGFQSCRLQRSSVQGRVP